MMREQVIEHIELRCVSTFKVSPDRFSFRKDRPYKWLQRICFSVLAKIGCSAMDETVRVERHVIDGDDFMGCLLKQNSTLHEFLGDRPTRLLMGAEDYAEVMNEKHPANVEFRFQSRYGKDGQLYGMSIIVIPWMRGLLVMP